MRALLFSLCLLACSSAPPEGTVADEVGVGGSAAGAPLATAGQPLSEAGRDAGAAGAPSAGASTAGSGGAAAGHPASGGSEAGGAVSGGAGVGGSSGAPVAGDSAGGSTVGGSGEAGQGGAPEGGAPIAGAGGVAGSGGGASCVCSEGECCDGCHFRSASYFLGEVVRGARCTGADYCEGTRRIELDYWNLFCSGTGATTTRWGIHTRFVDQPCGGSLACMPEGDQASCEASSCN